MLMRIILLLILLPTLAQAAQPLDKVVAVVNNDVITASELDAQVANLRQQIIAKNMEVPADAVLRKQVLQHLIDVDLQLQLAKNNSITIDSTELNEALNKIASTNN